GVSNICFVHPLYNVEIRWPSNGLRAIISSTNLTEHAPGQLLIDVSNRLTDPVAISIFPSRTTPRRCLSATTNLYHPRIPLAAVRRLYAQPRSQRAGLYGGKTTGWTGPAAAGRASGYAYGASVAS